MCLLSLSIWKCRTAGPPLITSSGLRLRGFRISSSPLSANCESLLGIAYKQRIQWTSFNPMVCNIILYLPYKQIKFQCSKFLNTENNYKTLARLSKYESWKLQTKTSNWAGPEHKRKCSKLGDNNITFITNPVLDTRFWCGNPEGPLVWSHHHFQNGCTLFTY